jgi:CheY-like chemotaxis protein
VAGVAGQGSTTNTPPTKHAMELATATARKCGRGRINSPQRPHRLRSGPKQTESELIGLLQDGETRCRFDRVVAPGASPRVLVVDDDPRFGLAVTALLDSAGIVLVGRAEDGHAGLALTAALRPDIVTMDIDMPVMDGVEATRGLCAQYPDVRVIVVTGSTSSERVEEALRNGAVGAISKAEVTESLVQMIRDLWTGGGNATGR